MGWEFGWSFGRMIDYLDLMGKIKLNLIQKIPILHKKKDFAWFTVTKFEFHKCYTEFSYTQVHTDVQSWFGLDHKISH